MNLRSRLVLRREIGRSRDDDNRGTPGFIVEIGNLRLIRHLRDILRNILIEPIHGEGTLPVAAVAKPHHQRAREGAPDRRLRRLVRDSGIPRRIADAPVQFLAVVHEVTPRQGLQGRIGEFVAAAIQKQEHLVKPVVAQRSLETRAGNQAIGNRADGWPEVAGDKTGLLCCFPDLLCAEAMAGEEHKDSILCIRGGCAKFGFAGQFAGYLGGPDNLLRHRWPC